MLHEFISLNREDIIRRCRAKVAARSVPPPTETEIDHGVPLFLDQLVDALRRGQSSTMEMDRIAVLHGHDLRLQGLTVSEVVHDYGDVCQSITELALETRAPISTEDFRLLNGCLDNAIARAVTEYGRECQHPHVDDSADRDNRQFGFLVHELRNLIHTAMLAFEMIKSGNVGVAGSTGEVLQRSLAGARDLMARALADVRLADGGQHPEPFLVSAFIQELEPAARLAADARGVALTVMPVEAGVAIEADRPILAAVMMNVLQNAFKFTKPRTTVTLRVDADAERVRIEVEDVCGGFADEDVDGLFRPFEQRGVDRTGAGLGLAFSRWATEANHGRISTRSLPGVGCVFTVDLARCLVPVPGVAPPTFATAKGVAHTYAALD